MIDLDYLRRIELNHVEIIFLFNTVTRVDSHSDYFYIIPDAFIVSRECRYESIVLEELKDPPLINSVGSNSNAMIYWEYCPISLLYRSYVQCSV